MKFVLEPELEKDLPVIIIIMRGHMTEVPGRDGRGNLQTLTTLTLIQHEVITIPLLLWTRVEVGRVNRVPRVAGVGKAEAQRFDAERMRKAENHDYHQDPRLIIDPRPDCRTMTSTMNRALIL
jgi:hypothetical protein